MPIDGRASVLGMGFGVGDLLLRYDFLFVFCWNKQTNRISFLKENHNAHSKTKSTWDR
jgi:hypothetical protein